MSIFDGKYSKSPYRGSLPRSVSPPPPPTFQKLLTPLSTQPTEYIKRWQKIPHKVVPHKIAFVNMCVCVGGGGGVSVQKQSRVLPNNTMDCIEVS